MAKNKKKTKDKSSQQPEVNNSLKQDQQTNDLQDQVPIEEKITENVPQLAIQDVDEPPKVSDQKETEVNDVEIIEKEEKNDDESLPKPEQTNDLQEEVIDSKPDTEEQTDEKQEEQKIRTLVVEEQPKEEAKNLANKVEEEETPEVSSSAPAPKKRLTLQERLALAAKSGKSKRNTSGNSAHKHREKSLEPVQISDASDKLEVKSPMNSPSLTSSGTFESDKQNITTRESSIDISEPQLDLFPSNFKELPLEELWKFINDAETKFLNVQYKNKSLIEEKHSLQEKIKNLNLSTNSIALKEHSKNEQLLKEKDTRIANLLKEGEELSVKELKYNNTIKKLKSKETDNTYEINELNKKVTALEAEKRDLKDSLKKSQDTEKQANLTAKTFKIQLDIEKDTLKEEISKNQQLSTKIEQLSQVIVQEKNSFTKEINALKRQVEKENQKFIVSKEEYSREVSRLEEKIEQLRYQSENAQAKTSSNDDAYSKLLRQYDVLQAQYTSATENWQSIEASLSAKINSFDSQTSDLQKKLSESDSKGEILSNDLSSKIKLINELEENIENLTSLKNKNEAKILTLEKSLQETEESLDDLQLKLKQDKSSLEFKVQTLEKQIKEFGAQSLTVPQPLDFPSSTSPLTSRNASLNSFKFTRDSVSFGESSTTPLQSRKPSSFFPPLTTSSANNSFLQDDGYSDYDDSTDTINSPVSQAFPNRYENGSNSAAIGGGSVQLLGKMSSQVRRLEIELASVKEELTKSNDDKKLANEEIVKLMKDNEQVDNYKSQISELEEQVEKYSKLNEKTLEILGEKSEQVEELKADVQDLKDLCKLQVQQMVDLQTK